MVDPTERRPTDEDEGDWPDELEELDLEASLDALEIDDPWEPEPAYGAFWFEDDEPQAH